MTKQFFEKDKTSQEYGKSPIFEVVEPPKKPVPAPHKKASVQTPPKPTAEVELIGFKATHRDLGDGVVVRVREADPINYIVIRYLSGTESEYREDVFTGWGGYFTHSGDDALRAVRAHFRGASRSQQPFLEPSISDREALIQERHRKKVIEAGKQYLGVRPARRAKHSRVAKCYSCKSPLDNSIDIECSSCGWILCTCGACGCGYSH